MRHLLILGALLGSTALATKYPLTVTDDLGRKVTLNAEPRRIIAMLPSHTETLIAIGAGDKLVAVDRFSNYPKDATDKLKKVGSAYQPDLEAILALKPDLVLADESSGSRLTEKLANAGLTVYGGTAQTYTEVFEKIGTLGKLTNREAGATKLITSMRRDLNAVQDLVRGAPKVSAYYEVDPSPYSVGPNSFIGVLLKMAGGANVIPANLGDFPKIDPELIVKANPSVMIGLTAQDARARPGWANLNAVTASRVFKPTAEERDALSRPGPRLPVALRALAKFLHPERF
ncbi:ABC transporter substrate-binding protein [Deinococcus maricopensis]|uniref:ABC-type transporter, periplasmic subunit n=1 Tax=Deinococcus maricopensis (strain DSM 21211 / LMG 22137 / NRRL B-23946 / LB-34) TaxID=709986 RepID=E8U9K1_DEIML|nr:ABC transporter substrate-binding protein [Deinococcus maricopensis]ADV67740.1 ABC-type transporter, periplasmic subunit [Deinococcus maricopensis DSM 21211]